MGSARRLQLAPFLYEEWQELNDRFVQSFGDDNRHGGVSAVSPISE